MEPSTNIPRDEKAKLWPSKEIPLLASAFFFTLDTVWIAGTCPPPEVQTDGAPTVLPSKGRLIALCQSTGQEQGSWDFPGEPAFEGLSAAQGRIYLTTRDGPSLVFFTRVMTFSLPEKTPFKSSSIGDEAP